MEAGGWILMAVSWGAISALAGFCMYRVLLDRPARKSRDDA